MTQDVITRAEALSRFNKAGYGLLNADSRLRGRATQIHGALSTSHARALKSLVDYGDLSVNQLAEYVENKAAAVTQLVNGMEKNGYVERIKTNQDRRVVTIRITARGLDVYRQYEMKLSQLQNAELERFSAEELNTAAEILNRMSSILDRL
jgi:Transcriptional regulators